LRLSAEALGYLERYRWPGNVRELRNVIERAAVLSHGSAIEPADLPLPITRAAIAADSLSGREDGGARGEPGDPAPDGDRRRIIAALEQCAGNQTRAAKLLGISRRTLVNRLAAYDIPRPRPRTGK
ncbi:MAG TPA: helix-turn-helix domain-containing protein, partial [Kofleriaceae bacterium]